MIAPVSTTGGSDMTFIITKIELIYVAIGILIGYKLKSQIQTLITNIKKNLSSAIAPKP